MKLMPQGDYYLWYCEWCDTRNLTLWTRVVKNQLCCAACQKKFAAFEEAAIPRAVQGDSSFLLCS